MELDTGQTYEGGFVTRQIPFFNIFFKFYYKFKVSKEENYER